MGERGRMEAVDGRVELGDEDEEVIVELDGDEGLEGRSVPGLGT
jgi:hypothetical protein